MRTTIVAMALMCLALVVGALFWFDGAGAGSTEAEAMPSVSFELPPMLKLPCRIAPDGTGGTLSIPAAFDGQGDPLTPAFLEPAADGETLFPIWVEGPDGEARQAWLYLVFSDEEPPAMTGAPQAP